LILEFAQVIDLSNVVVFLWSGFWGIAYKKTAPIA
jgi:hypothetical protein